jgi:hypothetical protein
MNSNVTCSFHRRSISILRWKLFSELSFNPEWKVYFFFRGGGAAWIADIRNSGEKSAGRRLSNYIKWMDSGKRWPGWFDVSIHTLFSVCSILFVYSCVRHMGTSSFFFKPGKKQEVFLYTTTWQGMLFPFYHKASVASFYKTVWRSSLIFHTVSNVAEPEPQGAPTLLWGCSRSWNVMRLRIRLRTWFSTLVDYQKCHDSQAVTVSYFSH